MSFTSVSFVICGGFSTFVHRGSLLKCKKYLPVWLFCQLQLTCHYFQNTSHFPWIASASYPAALLEVFLRLTEWRRVHEFCIFSILAILLSDMKQLMHLLDLGQYFLAGEYTLHIFSSVLHLYNQCTTNHLLTLLSAGGNKNAFDILSVLLLKDWLYEGLLNYQCLHSYDIFLKHCATKD